MPMTRNPHAFRFIPLARAPPRSARAVRNAKNTAVNKNGSSRRPNQVPKSLIGSLLSSAYARPFDLRLEDGAQAAIRSPLDDEEGPSCARDGAAVDADRAKPPPSPSGSRGKPLGPEPRPLSRSRFPPGSNINDLRQGSCSIIAGELVRKQCGRAVCR